MDIRQNDVAWRRLLMDVEAQCGLTATQYDIQGAVVLRSGDLSNDLCRLVQGHSTAIATVCSVAQQNIGREARLSREPAIGECDLGMVKMVVPILDGDEVIGFVGVCGAREPDVAVEVFLASQLLEVDEEALAQTVETVGVITTEVLQRTATVIQQGLEDMAKR